MKKTSGQKALSILISKDKDSIKKEYGKKGIASCRYSALEKICKFIIEHEFDYLSKSKEDLKSEYANFKSYVGAKLNGAENQAINDIYNLRNNTTTKSINEGDCKAKIINENQEKHLEVDCKKGLSPCVGTLPKVLILGTMPGDKSLRELTYYCDTAHNSFWKIMYSIFGKKEEISNEEFIISHNIALWDCVQSGNRNGSTDAEFDFNSIVPNDIESFLSNHPSIKTIVLNGKGKGNKRRPSTTFLYKYFFSQIHFEGEIISFNSTSNTCTKLNFEEKKREWSEIIKFTK